MTSTRAGLLAIIVAVSINSAGCTDQQDVVRFLAQFELYGPLFCRNSTVAMWAYYTDITDDHQVQMVEADGAQAAYLRQQWLTASQFDEQRDPTVRRKLKRLAVIDEAALSPHDFAEFTNLTSKMEADYSQQKVCSYRNQTDCDLDLDPELEKLISESRDPEELKFLWLQWYDKLGPKLKPLYVPYVELLNKAATANNLTDAVDLWLYPFESPTFRDDLSALWEQVKPLYRHLHAFVRRKLIAKYGEEVVGTSGLIPEYLLGNLWGQEWINILDIIRPFPNKLALDVTEEMKKQNYTVLRMFEMAEEFFTSLGMLPMTRSFWEESMFEKPEDREVVCHASAWDFCDGEDFRIKMCGEVKMNQFITVHHEMGHIQYDQQYANQTYIYQDGANSGFHEAVGDTISLSVCTPEHMQAVGLLDNSTVIDNETDINFLFKMASEKVAFLPFGYLVDLWRWDVFNGNVTPDLYNKRWWQLKKEMQGVSPPTPRDDQGFDAGPKYHVAASVSYTRYFVAHVLQFQFHKALCVAAGQYKPDNTTSRPLHRCDIYNSKQAGTLFSDILSLGSSKPWWEALELLTGSQRMDAGPLLEYFAPLYTFLQRENEGHRVDW